MESGVLAEQLPSEGIEFDRKRRTVAVLDPATESGFEAGRYLVDACAFPITGFPRSATLRRIPIATLGRCAVGILACARSDVLRPRWRDVFESCSAH